MDESSSAGHGHGSAAMPVIKLSISDATAQQSEEWLWMNGKFEYRNGQILIKEQSETPADVWVLL